MGLPECEEDSEVNVTIVSLHALHDNHERFDQ